jgi:hypothetical protein
LRDTVKKVEAGLAGHGACSCAIREPSRAAHQLEGGKTRATTNRANEIGGRLGRHTRQAVSVNVNKVATVRNSRGGRMPSVIEAVRVCIDAGAPGITVHPRADERHIRVTDVHEIAGELAPLRGRVEFNIEGDPRPPC